MTAYFVSWSGGKDSNFAMHFAIDEFGMPACLLTMMIKNGTRTRSHGLRRDVIEAQAESLGVTPHFYSADWADYQNVYLDALHDFKQRGITMGVFGDIRIEHDPVFDNHRQWAELVCENVGMTAYEPLWHSSENELIERFFTSGIRAMIIAVKDSLDIADLLGTMLTRDRCFELRARGIHPLGERGEFHTVVIDSPHFAYPLEATQHERVLRDGYWFLDITVHPYKNVASDH